MCICIYVYVHIHIVIYIYTYLAAWICVCVNMAGNIRCKMVGLMMIIKCASCLMDLFQDDNRDTVGACRAA